jgi:hypothetical protein
MSASCCQQVLDPQRGNETYRSLLWVVLAINAGMFAVEVTALQGAWAVPSQSRAEWRILSRF